MKKNKGLYISSLFDEKKWWKRYIKDGHFLRGNGEYWLDEKGFNFLRYFTKEPLFIPFSKMLEIKIGKWHGAYWGMGNSVVKIVWDKDGVRLSTGILVAKKNGEQLKENLEDKLNKHK